MKKNKFNLLNKMLMLGIVLGTVLVIIFDYKSSHLLTYCMSIPLVVVPFIFEKTRFKLKDIDKLVYYVFIFFAYFFGCVISLYNVTWWYDLVMHFVSGFIMGYTGIFILRKLNMYSDKNILFNFIYCLFFTAGAAGIWEIFEYMADVIIGTNLQHHLETGVVDTMQDLICGTASGLIFSFLIIFKSKIKKSAK